MSCWTSKWAHQLVARHAIKVIKALVDFGAPLMGLTDKNLESAGVGS
jgi:hypothetical protein